MKHEIGCHTFSHIDCSGGICPPEGMDSELNACQQAAAGWDVDLKSFVYPGNLVGNVGSLKKHGFSAYRWHGGYELDVPRQDEFGLWRIPGGICWEVPPGWSVHAWIGALQRCVDRALETGTVLHLWFHPSCEPINVTIVFSAVQKYAVSRSHEMLIATMGGLPDCPTGSSYWEGIMPWQKHGVNRLMPSVVRQSRPQVPVTLRDMPEEGIILDIGAGGRQITPDVIGWTLFHSRTRR